jgi:chemotaxis protein methyltransferase CheR
MVEFQQSNLAEPWPPMPPMDMIFMRNVLIYFGLETKKSILARIRTLLKPDGYLFLGTSETTLNLDAAFEPVSTGKTVCYKLRSAKNP